MSTQVSDPELQRTPLGQALPALTTGTQPRWQKCGERHFGRTSMDISVEEDGGIEYILLITAHFDTGWGVKDLFGETFLRKTFLEQCSTQHNKVLDFFPQVKRTLTPFSAGGVL